MDKSDIQETLVSLYLRLNGYFVSGFIVHADRDVRTEIDVLAVRFPLHSEPEREVPLCDRLAVPDNRIDLLVGEVKGGQKNIKFNSGFWNDPQSIRSVMRRFGVFDEQEIERVSAAVPVALDPQLIAKNPRFPEIDVTLADEVGGTETKLRFAPFASEQTRRPEDARPYVFEDDIFAFVWKCLRPVNQRPQCDVRYNFELWGPQYTRLVQFFKDSERTQPGSITDLYRWMNGDRDQLGATPMRHEDASSG